MTTPQNTPSASRNDARNKTLRIATRKSDLALWQARWVRDRLGELGHDAELVLIETQGDRDLQAFHLMQGQGFFTKAVQDAVIADEADVAVHSHKDLPSALMPQLEVAAISGRADPRDVLIVRPEALDADATSLPVGAGAVIGTSAARRQSQLRSLRPDLDVRELRGNVPTRVQKLRDGAYDAVVLAAAGLERLGLDLGGLEPHFLAPDVMVPAPAQGVLALECRRDDFEVASLLTDLHDATTYKAIAAERGLMSMLQGGCQLALGAHAVLKDGTIELSAYYEGQRVTVSHPSSEGAAMLAYDALGRPAPTLRGELP
ncbi:MAG: hydroxymethylbilane synthase [Trueperaceae bacterium]|nr:hydroxymethylbilane synthase [Trueperaceae bacterium]